MMRNWNWSNVQTTLLMWSEWNEPREPCTGTQIDLISFDSRSKWPQLKTQPTSLRPQSAQGRNKNKIYERQGDQTVIFWLHKAPAVSRKLDWNQNANKSSSHSTEWKHWRKRDEKENKEQRRGEGMSSDIKHPTRPTRVESTHAMHRQRSRRRSTELT